MHANPTRFRRVVLCDPRPVRGQRLLAEMQAHPMIGALQVVQTQAAAAQAAFALTADVLIDLAPDAGLPLLPPTCRYLPMPPPLAEDVAVLARAVLDALLQAPPLPRAMPRVILMGASTGGVEALYHILPQFPPDCPPVLIVQHMRPGHDAALVMGLARRSQPVVALARHGAAILPGQILLAPVNRHLQVAQNGPHGGLSAHLAATAPRWGHRPSVDELFLSASTLPLPPVAVVLTGMGCDGAAGLLTLRRAGARTLAQDQASSAVFGMPRAAALAGGAEFILPLDQIAARLLRLAQDQGATP